MAGSWRHILESATANPAIDRGGTSPGQPQHRAPVPGPRQQPPAQYHSAAQARSLLERELSAFSGRLAEEGRAPASARPMDGRPPAPPGVPAGYRPAPPSGAPAGYSPAPRPVQQPGYRPAPPSVQQPGPRPAPPSVQQPGPRPAPPSVQQPGPRPAPPPVQQPGYRPAPPPVQPSEYRLLGAGREPAAGQERAPLSQEEVPYQSLMDALSKATPAMLTEAEKIAPAERLPATRKALASPRKLRWRSAAGISALVLTAGVSAYVVLGHREKDPGAGAGTRTSQAVQMPAAAKPDGVWVSIPLPSRRPAMHLESELPLPSRPAVLLEPESAHPNVPDSSAN